MGAKWPDEPSGLAGAADGAVVWGEGSSLVPGIAGASATQLRMKDLAVSMFPGNMGSP